MRIENTTDTASGSKNSCFILSERSDERKWFLAKMKIKVLSISRRYYYGCRRPRWSCASSTQVTCLLYSLAYAIKWLYVKSDKTEFIRFNNSGIFSSNEKLLKLVDHFTQFGCNISFTKSDLNICIGKAWKVIKGYRRLENLISLYRKVLSLFIYL